MLRFMVMQHQKARELDERTLGDFVQAIGIEGVVSVAESLMTDLRDRVSDYRQGLERGDLDLVRRSVHSLKSAVAYVGGARFSDFCATLEGHARDGDRARLRELQGQFEIRAQALGQELRDFIGTAGRASV